MRYYTAEEVAYRARVAEHYAELPIGERRAYLDSLGMSRETMNYWVHHFGKYATEARPNPHGVNPEKQARLQAAAERRDAREARDHHKIPEPAQQLPYIIDGLRLENDMRTISIAVRDRNGLHPDERICTRAEFKCGGLKWECVKELSIKAQRIVADWCYTMPKDGELENRIKRLWQ